MVVLVMSLRKKALNDLITPINHDDYLFVLTTDQDSAEITWKLVVYVFNMTVQALLGLEQLFTGWTFEFGRLRRFLQRLWPFSVSSHMCF